MATSYNPQAVTNGLVFCVDAANPRSLPQLPGQAEHGWSEWICLADLGTGVSVVYSIVDAGVSIYERAANGNITTVVPRTTRPSQGTFTAYVNRIYYSDNGPINLVVEDQQHCIAPLTMAGTSFYHVSSRNNPETFYVYSPYTTASVNFYDNVPMTGAATSTITLSAGQIGTFTSNTLNDYFLSANTPVVVTAKATDADKTILSPMAKTVYNRANGSGKTPNQAAPATYGSYHSSDANTVMIVTIADGSGGDCMQGLGVDYLSDAYSWGNVLSDYAIVAPYPSTQVVVSYYNTSTNAWVVQETHNLSGTASQSNPDFVARDGTTGVGAAATNLSGGVSNFASGATLWRWIGNKPFYVAINDNTDDEFSMLGWLQNRTSRMLSNNNKQWIDIVGGSTSNVVSTTAEYTANTLPVYWTTNGGALQIIPANAHTYQFPVNAALNITNNLTIEAWVYPTTWNNIGGVLTYGTDAAEQYALWTSNVGQFVFSTNWPGTWYNLYNNSTLTAARWYHVVATFASGTAKMYINGVLANSTTALGVSALPTVANAYMTIGNNHPGGDEILDGRVSMAKVYNRVLSLQEVQQNFNAGRGRFNI